MADLLAAVETLRTRDARREREIRRLRHDVDALEAALAPSRPLHAPAPPSFGQRLRDWLMRRA